MVFNESNRWNIFVDYLYKNIGCIIVHDYNFKANLKRMATQLKLIVIEPEEILQSIFMWL